jgi:hypothetical protein
MEIIILMFWWKDGMFNDQVPTVELFKGKFIKEFNLILIKAKARNVEAMEAWVGTL